MIGAGEILKGDGEKGIAENRSVLLRRFADLR